MTQRDFNIAELEYDIFNIQLKLQTEENPDRIERLQYNIKILKSLLKNQ